MKLKWQPSNKKIGTYKCIQLQDEENKIYEYTLVGKHGEIWEYDDKENYRVCITNHRVANKLIKELRRKCDRPYQDKEECLLAFTRDEFATVAKAIEVYKQQERQIQKASKFGAPEDPTPQNKGKKSTKKNQDKVEPQPNPKNQKSPEKEGGNSEQPESPDNEDGE